MLLYTLSVLISAAIDILICEQPQPSFEAAAADLHARTDISQWHFALVDVGTAVLEILFDCTIGSSKMASLTKQLLWYLGRSMDRRMVKLMTDGSSANDVRMETRVDVLDNQQVCARYYQGTAEFVQTLSPLMFLSGTCDKARVGTKGVSACTWAVPSGVAWYGVPQDSDAGDYLAWAGCPGRSIEAFLCVSGGVCMDPWHGTYVFLNPLGTGSF